MFLATGKRATTHDSTAKHQHELGDTKYYFCSAGCKTKFASNPDHYLNPAATVLLLGLGGRISLIH